MSFRIYSPEDREEMRKLREEIREQRKHVDSQKMVITEEELAERHRLGLPCDGVVTVEELSVRYGNFSLRKQKPKTPFTDEEAQVWYETHVWLLNNVAKTREEKEKHIKALELVRNFPIDKNSRWQSRDGATITEQANAIIAERRRFHKFYDTREWLDARYDALKRSTGKCELCGREDRLHVDHIKPRSKYPELELEPSNLQVLCDMCNLGKSNRDESDWRK